MSCSTVGSPNAEDCERCGNNAPLVAALINFLLMLFLAFIGIVSGSKAILGSSLYAFKDFVTSLTVFISSRVSEKPADRDHPYGHGKIEFVAMLFIGLTLFIAAMLLFFHSVGDIWSGWQGKIESPKLIAALAGCIAVVANYKLYKYLHCIGTKLNSPAILATAKHHHSDAKASIFVVLAIIGTNMGILFLDPLVAVIETLDVMRLSVLMLKDGLSGVMDSSTYVGNKNDIASIARLVPGVRNVSRLDVRQLGRDQWVDITIKVDQNKSADEGYIIGQHVKESIIKGLKNVSHVSVSIEPYMP
jgi:cation diffusion facilitator family transporter